MRNLFKEIIIPATIMSSVIIGAGIFSLPYLFNEAGFLTGVFYLIFFVVVLSAIHLMYKDVVESTSENHRLVGYVKMYLGKPAAVVAFIVTVLGISLALTAYIVLGGSFLRIIFPSLSIGVSTAIFWAVGSIPIFYGVKKIAKASSIITLLIIASIIFIFIYSLPSLAWDKLPAVNWDKIYLPYTAILFSLYGRSAISSVKEYLKKNHLSEKRIGLSIFLGTVIPAILYSIFAVGMIIFSGGAVSENALSGSNTLPVVIIFILSILGMMSLFNSRTFLSLELKGIFNSDIKIKAFQAALITSLIPITLYLSGFNRFLDIIGFAGGVFIAIDSILVILMWHALKKRKTFWAILSGLMIFVFLFGAYYEIMKHLG